MQTIRGRLTAWYSAALALTLAAFAAVLYLDRRNASYQDLDQRMRSETALTVGILAESYRARGVLVRPDTAARPVLIPDVAALLEAVPDILIVTARDGSLLFASSDARALTFQQVEQLRGLAAAPDSGGAPRCDAFPPTPATSSRRRSPCSAPAWSVRSRRPICRKTRSPRWRRRCRRSNG